MPQARILIVEDEVIVREDLCDLLDGLGYEVVGAVGAGREAISQAQALRPDLVLMDIQLRDEMDGIESARSIRERLALPVVFLTAFADERAIEREGDLPLLAQHFLAEFRRKWSAGQGGVSAEAMHRLCAYAWPGNVRELKNVMEFAAIRGANEAIEACDLPP